MFILGQTEYWLRLSVLLILAPASLSALPLYGITEFGVEGQTLERSISRTLADGDEETRVGSLLKFTQ